MTDREKLNEWFSPVRWGAKGAGARAVMEPDIGARC
jgi:hypothetical protein